MQRLCEGPMALRSQAIALAAAAAGGGAHTRERGSTARDGSNSRASHRGHRHSTHITAPTATTAPATAVPAASAAAAGSDAAADMRMTRQSHRRVLGALTLHPPAAGA